MLPNFLGRDYAGGQLHITSETTKIDFQNDCSAEWFHWHSAEEADGRSGITVSKAHYLSCSKSLAYQTHFLTSYTDNSALVTSTKPTRKKASLKTLNKGKP